MNDRNPQYAPVGDQLFHGTRFDFDSTRFFGKASTPLKSTFIRRLRVSRTLSKQLYAAALLLLFGVLPFIIAGYFTRCYFDAGYGLICPGLFTRIFSPKVIGCGDSFKKTANSTVSGTEALFVLDSTFGRFPFSQVKMIDVAWDVGLGRTVQIAAWWISYLVFTDALLHTIERQPASFEVFSRICVEGPSIMSLWSLLKDLFRTKSIRTKFLFLYMVLGVFYVLSLPTILSAMIGYVSTSTVWVVPEGNSQMIPVAQFLPGWTKLDSRNDTQYLQYHNNTCFIPLDGRPMRINTYAQERDCK